MCILVAADGDEVVGYVYAALEPHSWKELRDAAGFIHDVAVAEGHRGRGIGSLLVIGRQRLAACARRAARAAVDRRAQRAQHGSCSPVWAFEQLWSR